MKKILVVDDSALMRRVLCDIINSDMRFRVVDTAADGVEALDLLSRKSYDAVVLDVNMPRMNGLELLKELQKYKIPAKVMMASTDTKEGARTTLDALELGAIDFVHKPDAALDCRGVKFKADFLRTLSAVAGSGVTPFVPSKKEDSDATVRQVLEIVHKNGRQKVPGNKIVAIASSTGGPRALQSVIPRLPGDLKAPVLIVQHMPAGFTASLAERLDKLSELPVKEAAEGDVIEPGHVYLARGGMHMNVLPGRGGKCTIHYSDEPPREGVKPCANYMYESLQNSDFDEIICVVMTGMGADGTKGISNLKTAGKKVHVIAQEESTCAVYGMPRSVVAAKLSNQIMPLQQIAQEIILNVGVM